MARILRSDAPTLWHPSSLDEAWGLLERHGSDAQLMSGGTLLHLDWEVGAPMPAHLIDITACDELNGISPLSDGTLRIGALTTLGDLRHDIPLSKTHPMFHEALAHVAASSVRNLATLGGNVAGRKGCVIPALLAFDADVEIFDGKTLCGRSLIDWLSGEGGAILTAIHLPGLRPTLAIYEKVGLRVSFSPSVIDVAAALWCDASGRIGKVRLAAGGGITKPQRLTKSEEMLIGKDLNDVDWLALHDFVVSEIATTSDAFRTALYRRQVAANAIVAGLAGVTVAAPAHHTSTTDHMPLDKPALYEESEISRASMPERWHMRPDSVAKTSGQFRYLTDKRDPDMLIGRILRAAHPHAKILDIDTSAAEALPGVHAVVTHRDVKGLNAFGIVVQDQPAFCADKVRYLGDAVAAVAAETPELAEQALALIRVTYEPLPLVTDAEAALAPNAALVHSTGNLLTEMSSNRGDVDAAWAQCAHIVEDTYVTPRQMHAFMETEGGYAQPTEAGGLEIFVGAQYGHRDQMQLGRILNMEVAKIRVVSSPSGGAFGGKDELTVQPALALLALKSGRAVRLQLERQESVIAGMKRHPMKVRMKTGCDASGKLIAQQVDLVADGGAYASLGPAVLETALDHVMGAYIIPNVSTRGRLAYTNNGYAAAFRGFGHNEMLFPVESQIGRLAELSGLDPVEFRWRNLRQPGDLGSLGQVIAPTDRGHETLSAAAQAPLWSAPLAPAAHPRKLIGRGLALAMQGVGLGSSIVPDDGGVRLALNVDGKIDAFFGADEIGQGVMAIIQETVSQALGCARDDVRAIVGDTGNKVDSGSTTASRMTYVVWRGAKDAGPALRDKLITTAAAYLQRPAADLTIGKGGIYDSRQNRNDKPLLSFVALATALGESTLPTAATRFAYPATENEGGNARFLHCYGVTVARVAVDRITGAVEVLDLNQHTAAGPVLDVANYQGQIEGGGVQGVGFTLMEDTLITDGQYITKNFDTYMVPTIADAPCAMKVYAMESLDPDDTFGPRGIGELGMAGVTPAIAAAVADATGVWMTNAPFDPEILLSQMSGFVLKTSELA